MPIDEVTVLVTGDTGAGKSSFGNFYLQTETFQASDSINPVTLKAVPSVPDGLLTQKDLMMDNQLMQFWLKQSKHMNAKFM